MPTWTKQDLQAYERRQNRGASSSSISQRTFQNEPVAKTAGENKNTDRIRVCVTSYRRRLCDPDNLSPKYFIDCLRYAKIIPDDSPEFITLEVSQKKVNIKTDERTEMTIEAIS